MVQIAVCKLSHVLGSESGLVWGRDLVMGKGGLPVRRARLRKVAKEIMVHWHLQRNVMDIYLRYMGRYTHRSTRLYLYGPGDALDLMSYILEYKCGVLLPGSCH